MDLGNTLAITRAGVTYGLFAPSGSDWSVEGSVLSADLGATGVYSAAVLPDGSLETLQRFAAHAFAVVTDTRVSWAYDPANGTSDVTYEFVTQAAEGSEVTPLVALYRHQWLHSDVETEPVGYASARGEMKLAATGSFVCRFPFRGVLPGLADAGGMTPAELAPLVQEVADAPNPGGASDTYFFGKALGRAAQAVVLAEQAGMGDARESLLDFLREGLTDWFTVGELPKEPGEDPEVSAYERIEAESFGAGEGVQIETDPARGEIVTGFGDGDWIRIDDVDFSGGTPTRLVFEMASGTVGSGLLEIRIDAPDGPVIAGGGIGSTGGVDVWTEAYFGVDAAGLEQIDRVHDVYVTVDTPYAGEIFRLDAFRFDGGGGTSGPSDLALAYIPAWNTIVGEPGSFGLASELNDHHFHYGYLLAGAAALAARDSAFASAYTPMVELLIRDVANADRSDEMFPFLRNFDPYAGHGYASGHANFAGGNNQESSSESMNFAQALVLWGVVTGDEEARDLGIFLHATESAAIDQYWFDVDQEVFPPGVALDIAGVLWDYGADYATFFGGEPELVHGINYLPVTGGSLYLGAHPDALERNYDLMVGEIGGAPTAWASVLYSALALADPARALSAIEANPSYAIEGGDSRARTEHWVRTLAQTGPFDPDVRGDLPTSGVFGSPGSRTYMIYNPSDAPVRVTFTDGLRFEAPPGTLRAYGAGDAICRADLNGDGSLDFADVVQFLGAFQAGKPGADFDEPLGVFDFNDVVGFLVLFGAGCP